MDALKKRKQNSLRKLNDRILKEAAINFTRPLYRLAVLSYVFAKIMQKPRFLMPQYTRQLHAIESSFARAADSIERVGEQELLAMFSHVEKDILALEKRDIRFITNLVQKGQLKTAAIMYAQGISLGVAAEMTGMDKQEILSYAGETMMFERIREEAGIKDRMKIARRFLGGHE